LRLSQQRRRPDRTIGRQPSEGGPVYDVINSKGEFVAVRSRFLSHFATRTLITGTLLGALILGVGGRLAMAAITASTGASPRFTLGGTLTVMALGAASGLAGGALALISRIAMGRLLPSHVWPQHVLFAALLLLVTLRGLRGTAPIGRWWFLPLVAVYGIILAVSTSREAQSQRPLPRDTA
jgi:hypothetical protein